MPVPLPQISRSQRTMAPSSAREFIPGRDGLARPNGPVEPSPGLRLKADALGQGTQIPAACKAARARQTGLEPTGFAPISMDRKEDLAALQAAGLGGFPTQGIGLRPQPWAPLCRPVGPGLSGRKKMRRKGGPVAGWNASGPPERAGKAGGWPRELIFPKVSGLCQI
jgi:hypothetical protein